MMAQIETNWMDGPNLTFESLQKAQDDLLEACGGQWPIAGFVITRKHVEKDLIYEVESADTKRRYVIMSWQDYFKLKQHLIDEDEVASNPLGIVNRFGGIPVYEDDELAERLLFSRRFNKAE